MNSMQVYADSVIPPFSQTARKGWGTEETVKAIVEWALMHEVLIGLKGSALRHEPASAA